MFKLSRFIEINKKIVPTMTWSPWNPVAIKKHEPKIESEKVYEASQYSHPWRHLKYAPSTIVNISLFVVVFPLFLSNLWWDHVTEIPEASNTTVFNRGIWKGFIA